MSVNDPKGKISASRLLFKPEEHDYVRRVFIAHPASILATSVAAGAASLLDATARARPAISFAFGERRKRYGLRNQSQREGT